MIAFFRNIRQTLVSTGSLRKYILYAIGEIALVMIGILLALQVNNWNEYRKSKHKERAILIEIRETLERNIAHWTGYIEDCRENNLSTDMILAAFDAKQVYHDSLDFHFAQARIVPRYVFISYSGFEQYKDAGFEIIRNNTLRKKIIDLFENKYASTAKNSDFFLAPDPFRQQYQYENFYNINGGNLKPINYQKLMTDSFYRNFIMGSSGTRIVLIRQYQQCLDESQKVLELINKELKE